MLPVLFLETIWACSLEKKIALVKVLASVFTKNEIVVLIMYPANRNYGLRVLDTKDSIGKVKNTHYHIFFQRSTHFFNA